jgi:type I restriction enzyme M protein
MNGDKSPKLADFIWNVANKLRGPYRPPQYRKVMLPLIVLRRLDCVLEATKDDVLKQYAALKKKSLSQTAIEKALAKTASKGVHLARRCSGFPRQADRRRRLSA